MPFHRIALIYIIKTLTRFGREVLHRLSRDRICVPQGVLNINSIMEESEQRAVVQQYFYSNASLKRIIVYRLSYIVYRLY